MSDEIILIDTNILVYAFDKTEKVKQEKAKQLLEQCFMGKKVYAITLQNISEFFVAATKKVDAPLSKKDAANIAKKMMEFKGFIKLEQKQTTVIRAIEITAETGSSYWDTLIATTMVENNIFHIYTEDLKDFSKIVGIKATNPLV